MSVLRRACVYSIREMLIHERPLVTVAVIVLCFLVVSCDAKSPAGPAGVSSAPSAPAAPKSTGPIAFVSDRDGTQQIYLANEDGSEVTRLTPGTDPAWSRDGGRLAFQNGQAIFVINVDGSGLRRVAGGWDPTWSPDGRMLAFRDLSSISVVGVDGSNQQRLYYYTLGLFDPAWSPDGRRIAFSVGTYVELGGVWVINADGSEPHQVGPEAEGAGAPAWSPDGSEIAFVAYPGVIGVMNADGAGERLRGAGQATDVDWTPDGRLIFTKSPSRDRLGPNRRVFVSDGGVERQLIPEVTAPARSGYSDGQATWRR